LFTAFIAGVSIQGRARAGLIFLLRAADSEHRRKNVRRRVMFYLLLRLLNEEMETGKITADDYRRAVVRAARFHGIQRNGIR
jgi:hypothetical protein